MNKVFNIHPRKVILNVQPGCYIFEPENAIGKTYLGKLITKLSELGELNACYITYSKSLSIKATIEELAHSNFDIVFLDRFDLYVSDDLCRHLNSTCEKTVYLMDLKDTNKIRFFSESYAEIILAADRVEVRATQLS